MSTFDVKRLKHGPPIHASHREVIEGSECWACGHIITDHKRAGQGGESHREHVETMRGRRDGCIGDRGTCRCTGFRAAAKIAVVVP